MSGSRDFYVRPYHGLLPPRAADMLTAQTEQLAVRGLSPLKIGSLVGCSSNFYCLPGRAGGSLLVD